MTERKKFFYIETDDSFVESFLLGKIHLAFLYTRRILVSVTVTLFSEFLSKQKLLSISFLFFVFNVLKLEFKTSNKYNENENVKNV